MNTTPPGPSAGADSAAVHSADGRVDELAQLRLLTNRLFSLLSHDLRTPLSAISGWLYLLESGKLDAEASSRALAKIRDNVEQQVQLIDDTFLLSCCKTGHLQLDLQRISPGLPLSAAMDSVRVAAQSKGIDLRAIIAETNALVSADARRLQRVFELLLGRAIGHSPAGGTVSTSVLRHNDCVEVLVSDDGEGISPMALPVILDPAGAPDDTFKRYGKGQERGLLLAGALVEAHGGQLRVTSAGENRGVTVTVGLPLPSD